MPFASSNLNYLDRPRPLDYILTSGYYQIWDIRSSPAGTNSFTSLDLNKARGNFDTTSTNGWGVAAVYSPDGNYIAVGSIEYPYLWVYKNTGGVWNPLPISAFSAVPGGQCYAVAWNPDGTSLAVAGNGSPLLTIYNRSGDTFTKLTDPATLPPGTVYSLAWNADGTSLITGGASTPYIRIYNRSGDTFTALSNPATLPASTVYSVAFNTYGNSVATGGATTPFINIYNRSSDTFTKLTNPATLPTATVNSIAWNNDSSILGVASGASLYCYNRYSDTFVQAVNQTQGSGAKSIAWNGDSSQIYAVGAGSTSVRSFYSYYKSGNTLTLTSNVSNPDNNILGTPFSGVSFFANTNTLLTTYYMTPGLASYTVSGNTFTNQNMWGRSTSSNVLPFLGNTSSVNNSIAGAYPLVTLAISPNGQYIVTSATGAASTQNIQFIKRNSDTSFSILTQPTAPAGTNIAYNVAFNPQSTSVALSSAASTFVYIYNISGSTVTKLANPASLPPSATYSCSWNSDGTSLAVGPIIYNRSGDTFSNIGILSGSFVGAKAVAFNPSVNNVIAVGNNASPYLITFTRSGDTFTQTTNPDVGPTGQPNVIAWNPQGTSVCILTTQPAVAVYNWNGSQLIKLTLPSLSVNFSGATWNNDGSILYLNYSNSGTGNYPFIIALARSGDTFTVMPTITTDQPHLGTANGSLSGPSLAYYYTP